MQMRPTFLTTIRKTFPVLSLMGAAFLLSSCATKGTGGSSYANHPAMLKRKAEIATEPAGDYWIGRRWWTEGTRFWGYLRRPREPWSSAKLVVFNEHEKHQPDRLAESPETGPAHGFDHNHEYKIFGHFSGQTIYDPNSNLLLPEFILASYELISANPGFLFQPGEAYNPKRLPPKLPPIPR